MEVFFYELSKKNKKTVMPQLAKGGKYVFGFSLIRENYRIHMPPEAYDEYKLQNSKRIVLCSGSKTSGGFGVMSLTRLADSSLREILRILKYDPDSHKFELPENDIIPYKKGLFAWTKITDDGIIDLPRELCIRIKINIGDRLVVVRGGKLGPTFLSRGPLHQLALEYKGLLVS